MATEIGPGSFLSVQNKDMPFPLVLAADTIEDYATAVALTLRQRSSVSWLPVLLPSGSRLPKLACTTASLHVHVGANQLIATQEWIAFQKLWLRWHAPLDYVDPLRWYLTAAWPSSEPPTGVTEVIDHYMQQLAALPPHLRLQQMRVALRLGETGGAVVGWGDYQWTLPAMLHASLTGKPFLWCMSKDELIEVIAGNAGSLTVCIPQHQLDLDFLQRLTDIRSFRLNIPQVQALNFSAQPLSFFTARTFEILTRLPVKHHLYRQTFLEQSAWVLTGETVEKETDPDVTLLTKKDAHVGQLQLIAKPDVLVLWGHSREDMFHLGTGALCGMSAEAPLSAHSEQLPACFHDGHCVKNGDLLPATRLTAKVLLLAGCNLMRLGGQGSFAPEYTLAFSSLEGMGNLVVASRRTRFGHPCEQIFMYQLIKGGMTIGEAVRVVNNSLPFSGPESPDYLVLGEGDWAPFAPLVNLAQIDIQPEQDGWQVECHDVDAQYIEIRLARFSGQMYVHLLETAPELTGLFYAVSPEPDGSCRLFLFGWRRLQAERIVLRVGATAPLRDQQQMLSLAYRNQAYGRLFRSYLPKFKNWEQELRSLGSYIARRLTEARYLPIAYHEAEVKAVEAEALLGRMDHSICAFLLERIANNAFVWLDQYMEVDGCFQVVEHLPSGQRCPYCASSVARKVIRNQFDQQVAREFATCQTCGNVWDIPLEGINPVFSGGKILARASEHHASVTVKNIFGRRVRGWLGFRVYQAQKHGVIVDPPVQELVLESGEEVEVPFTVHIGERMPAHMEFVRGFWVSELSVSVFQRNIWVVPAGGVS